jgi:hypothetical protein
VDFDFDDEVLLGEDGGGQEDKREQNEEAIQDGDAAPSSCGERRWRPG